jgi:hypothetical protein
LLNRRWGQAEFKGLFNARAANSELSLGGSTIMTALESVTSGDDIKDALKNIEGDDEE